MCHKNRASRRNGCGRRQARPTLVGMLVQHVVAKREEKRALTQGTAYNQTPNYNQPQTQIYQAPVNGQTPPAAYGQAAGYNSNQGYRQNAEFYHDQSRGLNQGGLEGGKGVEKTWGGEKREHWVDEKKWNGEEGGDVNAGLVDEVAPPRYSVIVR